jgi:hypothetical protein
MPSSPYTISSNPRISSKVSPTSEIKTSVILEWLKLRDLTIWSQGHLQCRNLVTTQGVVTKVIVVYLCTL